MIILIKKYFSLAYSFFFASFFLLSSISSTAVKFTNPFTYQYETGLVFDQSLETPLSPGFEQLALKQNTWLNESTFFNTSFIKQTAIMKKYHCSQGDCNGIKGEQIAIQTTDGISLGCTYFNRSSDKLLIIAMGFTNAREYMSPFIDMFNEYDLVLFDFRGHGYQEHNLYNLQTWKKINSMKVAMGVDSSLATLGVTEEKDVFAVVDHFTKNKTYKEINGLGVCYGAFILAKAQAQAENDPTRKKLFNKIILDGCWLCVEKIKEKIKKDPMLIFNPQRGGWSETWPFNTKCFSTLLEVVIVRILGLSLHRLSLLDYLSSIKNCSVLFWYGKDDKLVHRGDFEEIWNALQIKKKAAVITSNPHVINHFKQKELYKFIGDLFFSLDYEDFKRTLLLEE